MKIIEEIPTEFQRIIVEVGKSSTDHHYLLLSLRNILLAAMQNFGGSFFETLNCLSALSEENFNELIATKSANYAIFTLQISANLAGLRALLIWSAAHYILIPEKVNDKGIIGQNKDDSYTVSTTGTVLSDPSRTSVNENNYNSPINLFLVTKNNCGGNILFFDLFCRQIQQIWKVLTRVRVHLKHFNNHIHIHIHNLGNEIESNNVSVSVRESRESYMTLSTKLEDIIMYQCNILNELISIRTPTLTLTITTTTTQQHQLHHEHQHQHNKEYHDESLRITKAIYTAFTVILNGWETVLQFNGNGNGIKKWNEELFKFSNAHNVYMKIECSGMTHKEGSSIRLLEHSGVIGYGNQGFTVPAFLAGLIDLTAGFTERHTVNRLPCFVSSCLVLSFLALPCFALSCPAFLPLSCLVLPCFVLFCVVLFCYTSSNISVVNNISHGQQCIQ